MNRVGRLTFLMGFICTWANLFAQVQLVSVQGQFIDGKTKEPLSYASLYIRERSIGTVTNEKGDFLLRVDRPTQADTLLISLLGYQTKRLPILRLLEQPAGSRWELHQVVNQLREVVVRPIDAVELVTRAVKRIPDNYPEKPILLTGFYREWIREQELTLLSEGQLEVYKAGCRKGISNDAVRFVKGRRKQLPDYFLSEGDTCRIPSITNGPHLAILLDLAKPPTDMTNFLSEIGPEIYTFDYAGMTSIHDRDAYEITFTPNLKVAWRSTAFFAGKLFIDKESLAIVQAEYDLSTIGRFHVNRELSLGKLPLRVVKRRHLMSYHPHDGRYVLHHVQVDNEYRYSSKQAKPITNRMDFLVTKTTSQNVQKIPKKASIALNQSFSEQVMPFDTTFWAKETILEEVKN